ncbi:hypothetical protein [Rhodococcus sovatensis]|uniref:DUF4386 domain-containing protein n=1 Tax=Rhodococcus sovatensis TaxID=1805840 RepID=A0ABZ2PDV2_9NOCA
MDRQRSAAALLVGAGVLFAIYPILRPYSSELGRAGADAFASPLWIVAHVSAMIGFITLVLALRALNVGTAADVTTLIGVALVLPYYGAETFALNVLGADALDTGNYGAMDLAEPIRYGMTQSVMFGVGLVAIAIGAFLVARRVACWQGWVFAAGFVLFLPQFFAPPWMRIAHGLLILAGAVLLAARTFERQEISTTTGA